MGFHAACTDRRSVVRDELVLHRDSAHTGHIPAGAHLHETVYYHPTSQLSPTSYAETSSLHSGQTSGLSTPPIAVPHTPSRLLHWSFSSPVLNINAYFHDNTSYSSCGALPTSLR
jgi:hypothetical protein